jgi:hypothetical protein
MTSAEHQQTPSADVLLAAAHARAVERVKLAERTVSIPLLSARTIKIRLWRVLGIVFAIISMPFVFWGIFIASWHIASLFFEPLSPGHDPRDAALNAIITSPHPRGREVLRRGKSHAMIAMRRKGRSWHHHLNL